MGFRSSFEISRNVRVDFLKEKLKGLCKFYFREVFRISFFSSFNSELLLSGNYDEKSESRRKIRKEFQLFHTLNVAPDNLQVVLFH